MVVSKTCDHIQIKIKMPNPSQEPPVSSKVPNEDLKDMDVLCTFKIMVKSQNLDQGCINSQWTYPNRDQDAKPQAETSSICQSPKWGLKEHECSLHLQNQVREQKFGSFIYQRPLTKSKSIPWCQSTVRNLQLPPKLQIRTHRTWMFFAPSKSKYRAKIWVMVVSKTCYHIQINIKMPNPREEPPASSKSPNEDLKDMDVLCTFKIKIESQNLDHGCINDQTSDLTISKSW